MSIKTKKREKKINNTNSNKNNSPDYSSSSSIFEDINFSALFNPNDKYINYGEKTDYNLMEYDLGIFSSLSSICKNLNISEKLYSNKNSSAKSNKEKNKSFSENNNENTINSSNNKNNVFTDSILNLLLSESESGKNKNSQKESSIKRINKSGFSLNEEDLEELLKDYSPMEIEKKI